MTPTTLLEAHRRFAAALDDLRRKYVVEFERWLNAARGPFQQEAEEKIATARGKFADEFLDQQAPPIVRALNREAEQDILHALRSYEAHSTPRIRPPPPAQRWHASLWRTVVAAAFGAVAAVILLALQPIGEAAVTQPPSITQPVPASPVDAPSPTDTTRAPAPPTVMIPRDTMVLWLIAAAFVAALGATIGVFVVACPPVEVLLARTRMRGLPLRMARKLGAVFALLRAGPLITLTAVCLGGLFALIAWLLGGSKPLHVLIGLSAIAAMLAARWTAPDPDSADDGRLRRRLAGRLDAALQADSQVWAALSAALVLKRDDSSGARADAREITNIILSRRAQREASEEILQVIEQHLGLPSGGAPAKPRSAASEFVWKPEHAQDYDTFGVVDVGDPVNVSSQPLYIEDPNGSRRVSQKGIVTRKR